ncbi:ABC transporter permease [Phycicoccus flavus]|uniref:ABC transporter permease n=1 Tax=Phycicoccus flavus TaxID=2502783 RepID=UPI000FEBA10C|nr:ABC transporter permease [Phycicoccus flavus]NHA66992.1 ABC transporter permease [Phycicoccus flavus]
MTPRDLLRSAGRNTFRRPLRAFLTIVAIAIGAFTFTVTSGLGTGINTYIDSQTRAVGASRTVQVTGTSVMSFLNERMEVYRDDMDTARGMDVGSGILGEEDLQRITSALGPDDEYSANRQVSALYYSHDGGQRYRFVYNGYWPGKTANLVAGDQLRDDTDQAQLIVPSYATRPLGFASAQDAVGRTVEIGVLGQDGEVRTVPGTVVGVQEKSLIGGNLPFGNQVLDDALQDASWAGSAEDDAQWYSSVLVTGEDPDRISRDVAAQGYATATAEQTVGDYKSIVNGILLLLNLLAGVAIVAAMFGIVNTLMMSIQERTRQIGMFRALGMGRRRVFSSVALEAALLGVIGSVVAVALGVLAGRLLGPMALDLAGLDLPGLELFAFDATSLVAIVLGVTVAALVAALPPALRAARMDPMDALRENR